MRYSETRIPVLIHARATIPFAVLIALLASGCVNVQSPSKIAIDDVPADLQVSGPVLAAVHATGFQVYTLKADTNGKLAWALKAPDATFDNGAGLTGKHYAGPTWESSTDGSKVVAKKIKDHASPAPDAVPWLLLEATSHTGDGLMSKVTFIQRIHTTGGKAPPVGDANVGAESRIPYTADYIFYGTGATAGAKQP